MSDSPADLLKDQLEYYRARAPEYDQWHERTGRYDRGPDQRALWFTELAIVQEHLAAMGDLGDCIELACGTGLWTSRLATQSSTLTAIDAVQETIAINRTKNPDKSIDYQITDLFEFQTTRRFDFVFFGFWLSHVPTDRFNAFWEIVRKLLKPQGRVFFVDSLRTPASTAYDHPIPDLSGVVNRKLNDGTTFRIVKNFYDPKPLSQRLSRNGWQGTIEATPTFFIHGELQRVPPPDSSTLRVSK